MMLHHFQTEELTERRQPHVAPAVGAPDHQLPRLPQRSTPTYHTALNCKLHATRVRLLSASAEAGVLRVQRAVVPHQQRKEAHHQGGHGGGRRSREESQGWAPAVLRGAVAVAVAGTKTPARTPEKRSGSTEKRGTVNRPRGRTQRSRRPMVRRTTASCSSPARTRSSPAR